MLRYGLFVLLSFLGAWLSFQVQPLIAKALSPRFGGAASVWIVALLFFQSMLVGGYAYAHLAARRLSLTMHGAVHLGLAASAAWWLHPLPTAPGTLDPGADPTATLLAELLRTVGPAYFLLTATAPLVQRWCAGAFPDRSPYGLYAVSNLGSLLALATYPFVFEPWLDLDRQARAWSWGFYAYVGLCAAAVVQMRGAAQSGEAAVARDRSVAEPPPRLGVLVRWALSAAAPSIVLSATTNRLAEQVAPVPLLWIVPSAIYLTTWIICFRPSHRSRLSAWAAASAAALVVQEGICGAAGTDVVWRGAASAAALAAAGMACHGALVDSKPSARYLTSFYLTIAIGGALGGVFVGWCAPRWFDDYYEYPFGMALVIGLTVDEVLRRGGRMSAGSSTCCAVAAAAAGVLWLSPRLCDRWDRALDGVFGLDYRPALDAGMFAALLAATSILAVRRTPQGGIVRRFAVAAGWLAAGGWLYRTTQGSAFFWRQALPFEIASSATPAAAIVGLAIFRAWRTPHAVEAFFARCGRPATIRNLLGSQDVVRNAARRLASALPTTLTFCAVGEQGFFQGDRLPTSSLVMLSGTAAWLLLPCVRIGGRPETWGVAATALTCIYALWSASLRSVPVAWRATGEAALLTPLVVVAATTMLARRTVVARREPGLSERGAGFILGAALGMLAVAYAPQVSLGVALAVACLVFAAPVRTEGEPPADAESSGTRRSQIGSRRFVVAYVLAVVAATAIGTSAPRIAPLETARLRNFYGVLAVVDANDDGPTRLLQHGPIMHGLERLDESPPRPTAYYAPRSGVGQLIEALPADRPRRLAMVGLGVGTLAAYGRPGDDFRFFEIDRDVERLARTYFRFLATSPADVSVVLGDGRLALERDTTHTYDLIVLDAFSGDAVPCHLLTIEACDTYLDRLDPAGYLALHISNTHLDFAPVVNGLARHFGLHRRFVAYRGDVSDSMSVWALLSRREIPPQIETEFGAPTIDREDAVVWTDKHHGLAPVLRWRGLPDPVGADDSDVGAVAPSVTGFGP